MTKKHIYVIVVVGGKKNGTVARTNKSIVAAYSIIKKEIKYKMKFSLTQAGIYVSVIGFLVQMFKLNIASEEITQLVTSVITLVGLGVAWYGRYRKGDITVLGIKK